MILDENVYTNGQDLTSRNLVVVLDLEVFLTSEASEKYREMSLPRKFVRGNLRGLLEHPLSEAFLTLKHRLLRRYAVLNVTWYLLFALSLTSVAIISTRLRVDLGLSCKPCDQLSASMSTCPYLLAIRGLSLKKC